MFNHSKFTSKPLFERNKKKFLGLFKLDVTSTNEGRQSGNVSWEEWNHCVFLGTLGLNNDDFNQIQSKDTMEHLKKNNTIRLGMRRRKRLARSWHISLNSWILGTLVRVCFAWNSPTVLRIFTQFCKGRKSKRRRKLLWFHVLIKVVSYDVARIYVKICTIP